jgi:hyperosmotically inducible periplasmic protein
MKSTKSFTQHLIAPILALAVTAVLALTPAASAQSGTATTPLQKEILSQISELPYISVFDNIEFEVNGGQVTLLGQVVTPDLKGESENVVKKIPGVTSVVNNIEVLPASPNDDRIRHDELAALNRDTSLQQYFVGPQPSIHIVVDNGRVTLYGAVNNSGDKEAANVRANEVHGVFGVTNNLRVQPQ